MTLTRTPPGPLTPARWRPVPDGALPTAKEAALRALSGDVGRRLVGYFDLDGDGPGVTVTTLEPVLPDDVTATDLLAARMHGVPLAAGAVRRLLLDGTARDRVLATLAQVPPVGLAGAGPGELARMESFYLAVKSALSRTGAPGATEMGRASALCSRKRPGLFPDRMPAVRDLLDLSRYRDYRVDWLVHRDLLLDADVRAALAEAVDVTRVAAGRRRVELPVHPLRLLGAALVTAAA